MRRRGAYGLDTIMGAAAAAVVTATVRPSHPCVHVEIDPRSGAPFGSNPGLDRDAARFGLPGEAPESDGDDQASRRLFPGVLLGAITEKVTAESWGARIQKNVLAVGQHGRRAYGHEGGFPGVGALVEICEPDGYVLAALSNTTGGPAPIGADRASLAPPTRSAAGSMHPRRRRCVLSIAVVDHPVPTVVGTGRDRIAGVDVQHQDRVRVPVVAAVIVVQAEIAEPQVAVRIEVAVPVCRHGGDHQAEREPAPMDEPRTVE